MADEPEVIETVDPAVIDEMQEMIAQRLEQLAQDLRNGKVQTIETRWNEVGGEIRFEYVASEDLPAHCDAN